MGQIVIPPDVRARAALAKRKRLQEMASVTGYRKQHQMKYWNDPAGWARDCIHWMPHEQLTDYQADVMSALPEYKRVSARATHGGGKSTLAALIILWFADTRDGTDWKLPTTASAWRQLEKYLWPEVHKWTRRVKWDIVGRNPYREDKELLDKSIKLSTGEAFAVASDNADLIEGAHADHLLYVFDESKAIPAETWDAAEGAFSSGDCMWLSISTPGEPSGRFYDIQSRRVGYQDWWVRHITLDECIKAGRVNPVWAENRKHQWGEDSAVYQNRVLGNFASSDEDGIIPLVWVERAIERWHKRNDANDWGFLTRVSVDVGRGGDPTVLARRHEWAIKSFEETNDKTVMPVTGRVRGILEANPNADAVIDTIGIGAGVYDTLKEIKELSKRTIAFVASAAAKELRDKTKEFTFANMRSAAWWNTRELLQDDIIDLPDNEIMIGDLTAPKWRVMSGAKIQVESKGDYIEDGNPKKGVSARLGRSTNYGDTVIQAYMPVPKPKIAGTFGR